MIRQGALRPSNLPKLALCSWFRASEGQTEAAARGTAVDTIYRQIIDGLTDFPKGSAAEIAAADWAADQTVKITGKQRIFARHEQCQVAIPGFPAAGEVDALCPVLFCSFDVKTGLYYDYELQMAAYAWGLMERFFADTWTVYLLYCDLRRVDRHVFTYAEARKRVLEVRARYEHAVPPAYNPYCSWCANTGECPALINRADQMLALIEKPKFDFNGVLAHPQRLGLFLSACRAIEPLQQQANDRVKQYLMAKTEVPGWDLVSRPPGKYVEAPALQPLVDRLGAARVLDECGHLSAAKYEKLCAEAGIAPDPAAVKQGAGAVYLRATPNQEKQIA
jgi:hypothetical protein